ncbi:MAG: FISUMP domain-containing protein, partial [Bacteroidales bacterium]|nr:FISUMP domain-containing protein [Bacteroidales bacterium]
MKPKLTLLFALTITFLMTLGQRSAIELTFTAVDSTAYVQLDSIKIMNRTQGGETVLVWPDTVLSVLWVGVSEPEQISGFRLNQNYPNPVGDQTTINLTVPEQGQVNMMVTDLLGRTLYSRDFVLSEGTHALLFTPGKESTYFLSANWRGERQTIKILHYGAGHQKCLFKYTGLISSVPEKKLSAQAEDFIFNPGDELLYIGYAAGLESGMLDAPEQDSTYTFQFATNIPCPETPTVKYKGQVYNTIQIFSQCWLKENLNVGTMINGTIEQSNNGTIEKYCYNNEPDSCTKYGGLYQWNEMMQYTTQPGARGICPPGWQLPIDEEWKVLEGAVDSQYGIGDPEWDLGGGYRGFDAGTNLKTTQGWLINSGTDSFGFSGFPSGMRSSNGLFFNYGWGSYWWSSTGYYDYGAWFRDLNWQEQGVARFPLGLRRDGFSVRCLRDKIYIPLIELTFTAVNNATHVQLDSIKVMNRTQG